MNQEELERVLERELRIMQERVSSEVLRGVEQMFIKERRQWQQMLREAVERQRVSVLRDARKRLLGEVLGTRG